MATILFDGVLPGFGAQSHLKIVQGADGTFVQATQDSLDDGALITTAAAQVFQQAVQDYQLDPNTCMFIVHYAPGAFSRVIDPGGTGIYTLVEFEWSEGTATNPSWRPSTASEVERQLSLIEASDHR